MGNYIVGQSNAEFWSDASNNPQILVRETFQGISCKTFISNANSRFIKITRCDFQSRIVAGTFSATLYNKSNIMEKIEVSDGRFDLRYFEVSI